MYCYVVKWPVFRLQRGSAKSPKAPSNFSSLWLSLLLCCISYDSHTSQQNGIVNCNGIQKEKKREMTWIWKLKIYILWNKKLKLQSNLVTRNFLVTLKLFLMPNVPYPYEVNWQIGLRKWFLNNNLFFINLYLITKFDCTIVFIRKLR